MEPLPVILIVLLVVSTIVNIIVLTENIKYSNFLEHFSHDVEHYVEAFNETKAVVNRNHIDYERWGKMTNNHAQVLTNIFTILEIYAMALKVSPPSSRILESIEDQ